MLKKILSTLLMVAFFCSYSATYTSVSDECPYIRFSSTTLKDVVVDKANVKLQETSTSVVVTFLNGGSQTFTWSSAQARSYGYSLDSLYNKILDILLVTCGTPGGGGILIQDGGADVASGIDTLNFIGSNANVIHVGGKSVSIGFDAVSEKLLPEIISVDSTRNIRYTDVNKLITIIDATLKIPLGQVLSDGDVLAVATPNSETGFIEIAPGAPIKIYSPNNGISSGENLLLTAINYDGQTYLLPISSSIIQDGDTSKTAIKYLMDKVGNTIPLTGTEVGSPVTGDIEISSGNIFKCVEPNGGNPITSSITFGSELDLENKHIDDDSNNVTIGLYLSDQAILKFNNGIVDNVLTVGTEGIYINSNATPARGIIGSEDYTTNITDLDYTQKKYVDTHIADTASVLRGLIPDVSNFITSSTLADSLAKKTNKLISFNTYTTSDTLRLSDADKVIEMNVGTANNLVIPNYSDYAFPVGTQITLIQIGAGQTTLIPASGVTVRSASSKRKLSGQFSGATLIEKAINEWYLFGDITN